MVFRGSITQRLISLSTLRSDGRPPPRKTRFPAAGPALPDGIGYPQGFNERFHIVEMIPLSRASWRKFVRHFSGFRPKIRRSRRPPFRRSGASHRTRAAHLHSVLAKECIHRRLIGFRLPRCFLFLAHSPRPSRIAGSELKGLREWPLEGHQAPSNTQHPSLLYDLQNVDKSCVNRLRAPTNLVRFRFFLIRTR